jgi:hypothetical protein
MSRTSIKANGNLVVLTYVESMTDESVTREFMVPSTGGYVREWIRGDWKQVCNGLAQTGETLTAADPVHLLKLIRGEYRAMRRAEKREESRYV